MRLCTRWGRNAAYHWQISLRGYQKRNHLSGVSFSSHFHFLRKSNQRLLSICLKIAGYANTDLSLVFAYLSLFTREGRESWIWARLTHNEGLSCGGVTRNMRGSKNQAVLPKRHDNALFVKFIWNNSYLYCGCRWKWRVMMAVNFPI